MTRSACCCSSHASGCASRPYIKFEDIDAPLIGAFLDDLQKSRGIAARSRNVRLAAIRSFFNFAAFEMPAQSAQIQRVLAIPTKRFTRAQISFLTHPEVEALLAVPNQKIGLGVAITRCCWLRCKRVCGYRRSLL